MNLSCHRLIAVAWPENVCCRSPAMNFVQFFCERPTSLWNMSKKCRQQDKLQFWGGSMMGSCWPCLCFVVRLNVEISASNTQMVTDWIYLHNWKSPHDLHSVVKERRAVGSYKPPTMAKQWPWNCEVSQKVSAYHWSKFHKDSSCAYLTVTRNNLSILNASHVHV